MRLLWSLLLLAACKAESDDYPVLPGGGGGGNFPTSMIDAAPGDGITGDGATLTGRVCLLADLRAVPSATTCATTGADGITVTLGTATAMTIDDGSFSIAMPVGSNLVWTASGAGLVTSLVPLTTAAVIPAIGADLYNDMLGANGVIINSGQGALVVRVLRGTVPAADASAALVPEATSPALAATVADPLTWLEDETSSIGMLWIPGIDVPLTSAAAPDLTVSLGAETPLQLANVPIADGALTFLTAQFP